MKKLLNWILAAMLLMMIAIPLDAGRDNCKAVKIKIHNGHKRLIKVHKVMYYDFDVNKWRKELTWGILKLKPGETRIRVRNLEHVHNDKTLVKIYYRIAKKMPVKKRIRIRKRKYGKTIEKKSRTFVCTNGCAVGFSL